MNDLYQVDAKVTILRKEKWRIDSKGLSSTLLIGLILLIAVFSISMRITPTRAQGTIVRIIPATTEFGSGSALGEEFKIAVVIEDVADLYGVGLKIGWDTTYLDYINHTVTMPWNTSQTPIDPSPYAGILYLPGMLVANTVNEAAGTYDAAYSTMAPGESFAGNGTFFNMAFRVTGEPDLWEEDVNTTIQLLLQDLADSVAAPIAHEAVNATITIPSPAFQYPDLPLLKVMYEGNEEITGIRECTNFTVDVYLMGDGGTNLSDFWDIAGVSVIVNFNTTLLEALTISIDPDGWFASFWPNIITTATQINNTAGTVEVSFAGYGEPHTAPSGQGRLFNISFHSIFEAETAPAPSDFIYLKNPIAYTGQYVFDSIGGLIDIASPVGSTYNQITKHFLDGSFELISWEDNGDGVLSPSDQFILNDITTGEYFDYHLDHITGTLNLTLARTTDSYVWATNSITEDGLANSGLPGRLTSAPGAAYNGFGVPNWTGNFTTLYPVDSVNTITVHALPFTGDEYTYTLVAGVDFIVHADDDLIELLTPLDVQITNETWTDGVNNTLNGWPFINYVATSIQNVSVDMHNGTARPSPNAGFENDYTFGEWWYEPDWPWELEGWWALGYYAGSFNWPAGSTWWINYTAASYMDIDYNTDPTSAYVEFDGNYADFLAVTDPVNTTWLERYPNSWQSYTWENFTDSDTSGDITAGDLLIAPGNVIYRVDGVATDLITRRKPWIDNYNASNMYFGTKPIISLAGFPHPERSLSPWNNKIWSVSIPHKVENATYTAFAPPLVLTLTPDSGFAATTITGSGFHHNSEITITWNGTQITTVPYPLTTDATGNFSAIISVPTQNTPGIYNVTATDEGGTTITTTFTVVDMTGPQGESGEPGEPGTTGPQGESGEPGEPGTAGPQELLWASLILAIAALCLVLYVLFKKS